MKKKFFLVLFLIQACGHEQNFVEDDSFNAAAPLPSANAAPSEQPSPCQGFATSALFEPGERAGFGQENFPGIVLGPPQGGGLHAGSTDVLSLGTFGTITLDVSPCLVVDGEGTDFIVFENAFQFGPDPEDVFAEPARVSVSLDGESWTEFSCEASAYPYTGCAGWHAVLSRPDNNVSPLDAQAGGGDPFDLADIGIEKARYIRLKDAGEGLSDLGKAGFDLDAMAVVNGFTN